MNAVDIIQEMSLERIEKEIFLGYARIYDRDQPETFYLNYYELAWGVPKDPYNDRHEPYPGNPNTTHEMWEKFLDLPEIYRYRTSKIAKLAEMDASKAIKTLGANSDNVAALREIIKTSKAMQGGKQQQTVILSYVKPKERV